MKSKQNGTFSAQTFLDSAGIARKIVEYRRTEVIFTRATYVSTSCTSRRVA